jgi:hypothetical protein
MLHKKIISTFLASLSIWIFALLINAVLDACYIRLTHNDRNSVVQTIQVALVFSTSFSFPGFVGFWLLFLGNSYKPNLFNILLWSALAMALLSAILLLLVFDWWLLQELLVFFVAAIVAAVASVLLHHDLVAFVQNRLRQQPLPQQVYPGNNG